MVPSTGNRIPALDGLRGLAILGVIVLHVSRVLPGAASSSWGQVAQVGWIGVDLFFVLSGFLITGVLLDTRDRPGYYRRFYRNRVLRIFPLYYLMVAGVLFVAPSLLGTVHRPDESAERLSFLLYLPNWRMALNGGDWTKLHPMLSPFWSLAVEEQFYLVWPIVVFFARPRTLKVICATGIIGACAARVAALALGVAPETVYVLTPFRFDALLVGAGLALAVRGHVRLEARLVKWAAVYFAALMCVRDLWMGGLVFEDPFVMTIGYSAVAIAFGGLLYRVVAAAPESRVRRVCENRVLRGCGTISYGLYVFHVPVLSLTMRAIHSVQIAAAVGVAASFVVATLSWHLMEKQILRYRTGVALREPIPSTSSAAA